VLPFSSTSVLFKFGVEFRSKEALKQVNLTDFSRSVSVKFPSSPCARVVVEKAGSSLAPTMVEMSCSPPQGVTDDSYDAVTVTVPAMPGASAGIVCQRVAQVFRTDRCPNYGTVPGPGKADGTCATCSASPALRGMACPGGARVVTAPGYCVRGSISELPWFVARCSPAEACPGGAMVGADWPPPHSAPVGGSEGCAYGYEQDGSGVDTCCRRCSRGFCRFEGGCVLCPAGGLRVWDSLFVVMLLGGLGSVFYLGRSQTVYLFPVVVNLFKMSQVLALIALDPVGQCSSGLGSRVNLVVLPMFAGLFDLYELGHARSRQPATRLALQLLFTLAYFVPLLLTPLWLALKARRGGPSAVYGDIAPAVAFQRAITTWFWLMLLPLLYTGLGQVVCWKGDVLNYPDSPCPSAGYFAALAMGVSLFALVAFLAYRLARKVLLVSSLSDASDEDYLRVAFIYGHCGKDHLRAWLLDFYVAAVVLLHRVLLHGFQSTVAEALLGTLLPVLLLCLPAGYVARHRPFVSGPATAAYLLSLSASILAFFTRFLQSCSYSNGDRGRPSAMLNFVSLFVVIHYLASFACSVAAGWRSRASKGVVRLFEGYKAFEEDGSAPELLPQVDPQHQHNPEDTVTSGPAPLYSVVEEEEEVK
jgi:hypothetical protein